MEEDPIGANKKRVFEKMSQVQLEARREAGEGDKKRKRDDKGALDSAKKARRDSHDFFPILDLPKDLVLAVYQLLDGAVQLSFKYACSFFYHCVDEEPVKAVALDEMIQASNVAAVSGYLSLLSWITLPNLNKASQYLDHFNIAKNGQQEILAWLKEQGAYFNLSASWAGAAKGGQLSLLRWLKEQDEPYDEMYGSLCSLAVDSGSLEVIKWLREDGVDWGEGFLFRVTRAKNPEILEWALANGCQLDSNAIAGAAFVGDLQTIDWLALKGAPLSEYATSCGVVGGLDTLKHLREVHACPWSEEITIQAASMGALDTLRWAIDNGCPYGSELLREAANNGELDVLKYLHEIGCQPTEEATGAASEGGHLEVLQYLRSIGCPWDENTVNLAITGSHANIVKWAVDNGCHWNKQKALSDLVAFRNFKMLEYFLEKGHVQVGEIEQAYDAYAKMLDWQRCQEEPHK